MDKKNPNFMNFENFLNIDIKFSENIRKMDDFECL